MRVAVSAPGRSAARYLGLGRVTAKIVVVFSSFFFSGFIHLGLIPPANTAAHELRLHVAGFFWVQPLGFALEMILQNVGVRLAQWAGLDLKQRRGRIMRRSVTLIWVLTWLSVTLPLLSKPYRQLGWWNLRL